MLNQCSTVDRRSLQLLILGIECMHVFVDFSLHIYSPLTYKPNFIGRYSVGESGLDNGVDG